MGSAHDDGLWYEQLTREHAARMRDAAPDMIIALEDALLLLEMYAKLHDPKWGGDATIDSTIGKIRAVIAKTTGNQDG